MNAAIFLHYITKTVVGTEISVTLLSITKFIQKQYIFKSVLQFVTYKETDMAWDGLWYNTE